MTESLGGAETADPTQEKFGDITERLRAITNVLGFEESASAAEARADFTRRMRADGQFDPSNPEHVAALSAYRQICEQDLGADPDAEVAIGYQLAQATMWLGLGDTDRFYEGLDIDGDTGVVEMLYQSSHDAVLIELLAMVDELEF